MRPLFATDLDETLIYRKTLATDQALKIVAVSGTPGAPGSVMTENAYRILKQLADVVTVVPVTARSVEAFRRVQLPWDPRYVVVGNGATLLVDSEVDHDWARHMQQLRRSQVGQSDLTRLLESSPALSRVRTSDSGMVIADVVDAGGLMATLPALQEVAHQHDWYVSVQHQKVHLVPVYLRKEAAVEEIVRRICPSVVLAAGDSMMDRGLLEMATLGWRPPFGELHDASWRPAHVTVVAGEGVHAGEQILKSVLAQVR